MQDDESRDDGTIQRLLILHLNLAQICTGKALGETAAPEEWEQHILYYHHQDQYGSSSVINGSTCSSSDIQRWTVRQETIQFASLCIALSNLPSALTNNHHDNDQTTSQVHLDRSTLVFVPLEETATHSSSNLEVPKILAVVQISSDGTCDPLAIRSALERSHKLFCLLRYGGIHLRLQGYPSSFNNSDVSKPDNTNGKSSCPYPGMDLLFDQLKKLRRLREAMYRSMNKDSEQQQEESQLVQEIQSQKNSLPISSLTVDLKFHYDAFLADLANSRSRGAGRCLVEAIPAPIARPDGSHASKWTPCQPPVHVSFYLGQAIRALLQDNNLQLFAVSTFYQGQFLYHHQHDGSFAEENTSACLLMWYFASYGFQMKQQQQNQERFAATSSPKRISAGLVSFSDQVSVASAGMGSSFEAPNDDEADNHHDQRGHFLQTPPLAMLSASEQNTISVHGPSGELVWAPWVCYNHESGKPDILHALVYEWQEFSFLVFVQQHMDQSLHKQCDNSRWDFEPYSEDMQVLLERISSALDDCLNLYATQTHSEEQDGSPVARHSLLECQQTPFVGSVGRDVIFVDRMNGSMLLFPRLAPKTPKKNGKSPGRFMRLFRPKVSDTIPETNSSSSHDLVNWMSEGLDCRHWLSSRLSSDALRALDDAMNDVHAYRQRRVRPHRKISGIGSGNFEMLTPLPMGWIHAFADEQDREIYTVLDAREYGTMTEVQMAISEVRAALI